MIFDASHIPPWPSEVVRQYRRRHQSLLAAVDRSDLGNILSLDLRPEVGEDGRASIRLTNGSRLLLDFESESANSVTVLGIVNDTMREVAS